MQTNVQLVNIGKKIYESLIIVTYFMPNAATTPYVIVYSFLFTPFYCKQKQIINEE